MENHPKVVVRRRGEKREGPAGLTGAQRLKRWQAEHALALEERVVSSPVYDNIPRSRRSWMGRLRDLELHPDRVEEIKARRPKAYREPSGPGEPLMDELAGAAA